MNDNEYARMMRQTTGGGIAGREPVPRRGQNKEFDLYFDAYIGDEVPEGDVNEMRAASWATWRVEAPAPASRSGTADNEDDELERALTLSREELSRPSSARPVELDDDEELQRAIAMSEEEARAPKRQRRDETPEEERKMLEEALAASLAASPVQAPPLERAESDEIIQIANNDYQAQRARDRAAQAKARLARLDAQPDTAKSLPSTAEIVLKSATTPTIPRPASANSLFSDRAKMEEERLARQLAKSGGSAGPSRPGSTSATSGSGTSAGIAGPSISRPIAQDPRPSDSAPRAQPSAMNGNGNSRTIPARPPIQHPYQASGSFPRDAAGEYYLDGELRHTHIADAGRSSEPVFTAQSILGNVSEISLLILNSFVIDDRWLQSFFPDPAEVPQILIRPHPRDKPFYDGKVEAQDNGELWCYPTMKGRFGSQHMKYLWVFYKTGRLRVIISTANFVDYDWEQIENTIFIQDFLPLSTPRTLRPDNKQHDFPLQFRHLFKHLKVHKAIDHLVKNHHRGSRIPFTGASDFADMAKYDWSRVTVRLVMSIPGSYEGWDNMEKWGSCRIGQIVKEEGWKPAKGEKAAVEYQGSSLGIYSMDWFSHFYQLCSGKSARELANQPKAKEYAPIKIIFPSLATVDASVGGRPGGGTMFVSKSWNSGVKSHFHDANSKRGGFLMHAKLLVTTFEPQERALGFASSESTTNGKRKAEESEDHASSVGGWMYIGSHNFSPSAWGTINLKKNPPTLHIKNYEVGILFPLPQGNAGKMADKIVPYKRPVRPYSASDVPWDQSLHGVQQ